MGSLDPTQVAVALSTVSSANTSFPILGYAVGAAFVIWLVFLAYRKVIGSFKGR